MSFERNPTRLTLCKNNNVATSYLTFVSVIKYILVEMCRVAAYIPLTILAVPAAVLTVRTVPVQLRRLILFEALHTAIFAIHH